MKANGSGSDDTMATPTESITISNSCLIHTIYKRRQEIHSRGGLHCEFQIRGGGDEGCADARLDYIGMVGGSGE
jgi:hypothetical protein